MVAGHGRDGAALMLARYGIAAAALVLCGVASAADVVLAGVFGSKAVLVVNGGAPQTVAVGGSTREGVRLLEITGEAAVVRFEGQQRRLSLGSSVVGSSAVEGGDGNQTQVLVADGNGHYVMQGAVNGAPIKFLLDTGASMVSMGLSDARRAGIDLTKATQGRSQTANGVVRVWRVRLDGVRVGAITLHNVEGSVHEGDLPFALLGMSFLSRVEIQHESGRLTMKKRF